MNQGRLFQNGVLVQRGITYRKRYQIEIGFKYPPTALLYLTTMETHWTQRRWPSISVLLVITVISTPLTKT